MTTINWAGASGDWKTGATWAGGKAPTSSDYAVIGGTTFGTISVTTADAASKVSINDANATLAIAVGGTLSVGSAVNLNAGTLQLTGAQTLTSMTVNIGSSAAGAPVLLSADTTGVGVDLTLGSKLTINQTGHAVRVQTGGYANDTITNLGQINAGYSKTGAYFEITGQGTFLNQGTIAVSQGDKLIVTSNAFANGAGGEIDINAATLDLRTALTTAELGKIVNTGGQVLVEGTIDNTGAVLSLGAGTNLGTLVLDPTGVISGGVVSDAGSGVTLKGGQFQGVTFDGTLDLTASNAYLRANGLTLHGAGGAGPGQVNLTGSRANLSLIGAQTLDNAVIDIGADSTGGAPILYFYDAGGRSLTLGSGLTINQTGAYADLDTAPGDTTVNQGTINGADSQSGALLRIFGGGYFSNQGTLHASNGDTIEIQSTFLNIAGGTITGGVIEADAGSTIQLGPDASVAVDGANLILKGAGSTIQSLNTATSTQTPIEATLDATSAGGVLQLLAGRSWSSGLAFANAGRLNLAGGTFQVASLTNTGTVSGVGTVSTAVGNSGTLSASAGTLTLAGALTNTGVIAGVGTIALTAGSEAMGAGTQLLAAKIAQSATSAVSVNTSLTYAGQWSQTSGSQLSVSAGAALTLTGAGDVLLGSLAGAGVIALNGGADRLGGAKVSVGTLSIGAATVTLAGTIVNRSTISAASPNLLVAVTGATLAGAGKFNLSNLATNRLTGVNGAATLTNLNDLIEGGGQLGGGQMKLVNQKAGRITGNLAAALIIDTGANTVINAGTITANAGGGVEIKSAVANTGLLFAGGGTLSLDGAVTGAGSARIGIGGALRASGSFTEDVAFTGATGKLVLAHSLAYTGHVSGLTKTAGASLDLLDIGFISGATKATYQDNGSKTGGVLTVTDGINAAKINLVGDYTTTTFKVFNDGGGHALVHAPAAAAASGAGAGGAGSLSPFVQAMAGFTGPAAAYAVMPRSWETTFHGTLMAPRATPLA